MNTAEGDRLLTVDDLAVGLARLDLARHAAVGRARPATLARLVGRRVSREGRVEPEHVGVVVVPERHDEHHGLGGGLAELREAALVPEDVLVAKGHLLAVAELGREAVAPVALDGGLGVGDHLAVLSGRRVSLTVVKICA